MSKLKPLHDVAAQEIEWYRKYGKYPERIVTNIYKQAYVVGDSSWNSQNKDKQEFVERIMGYCTRKSSASSTGEE